MNSDYRKLEVWHLGMELCHQIYDAIDDEKFPRDDNNLVSQMKRAVISIPTNIAEGASSKFEKNFLSYLNIAFCSLKELETLIKFSHARGYISDDNLVAISRQADKLGAKLYFLLEQVEKRVKERDVMKYGLEGYRKK